MTILGRTSVAAVALLALGLATAAATHATVSGKNGRIVFRRYLDVARTTSAIFTVDPDGTSERQVTQPPPGADDREPDWSPSGAKIAFERKTPCPPDGPANGLEGTCDVVFTVNRNGKHLTQLVPCSFDASRPFPDSCVGVDDPAWSPNGSRIAFAYSLVNFAYTGSFNVDAGIWTVNADGTGLRQVTQQTPGTGFDSGPQWSPDGKKLVFTRFDLTTQADAVFTVDVDGSDEFQVTPWQLGAGDHPDWSPDGRWLVFHVQPGDGTSNIYKAHPDGTAITNLTNQGPDGFLYLSAGFSPDGKKIVTARRPGSVPGSTADVVYMNTDGSATRYVTHNPLWDSGADWGTAPVVGQ